MIGGNRQATLPCVPETGGQADRRVQQPARWHLITPEYPPQLGGVSDYTYQVAAGLAGEGDEVHVWCPSFREGSGGPRAPSGVSVHRGLGNFAPEDLRRVGEALDRLPGPRHILVQWVPHGYGYRSMNLAFCWWLRGRARQGDRVELMVHEPFLEFDWTSPRQNVAALVHRLMTILLLQAADRVWMSIPGWEKRLRPYALGRGRRFRWLPIPSNIPIEDDSSRVAAIRDRFAPGGRLLIGHFGTYGSLITNLLGPIVSALAGDPIQQTILLMGQESEEFRQELIRKQPRLASLVAATGKLPPEELSCHLAACDVLIQPYPDGVSSRRTSFMAGLGHGKAMVTTTGKLTEPLWSENGAVALAPVGDTQAFVDRVRELSLDASRRLRAGTASRRLYEERFDSSHIIATLRQAEVPKDSGCAFS